MILLSPVFWIPLLSPLMLAVACAMFSYREADGAIADQQLRSRRRRYDMEDRGLEDVGFFASRDLYLNISIALLSYDIWSTALPGFGAAASLWGLMVSYHVVYLAYAVIFFERRRQANRLLLGVALMAIGYAHWRISGGESWIVLLEKLFNSIAYLIVHIC